MKTFTQQITKEMMPYEKSRKFGISALSDEELIAVILRTGSKNLNVMEVAGKILHCSAENPGLLGLHYLTEEELKQIEGVGKVKAFQLLCVVELAKRFSKEEKKKGLSFCSPGKIAEYYMQELRCEPQEHMKLLLLNNKNRLIQEIDLSKGNVNSSFADPRDIFRIALKYGAVSIVLIHNHPSGDPSPSREDLRITQRISDAGKLIGICLLDHIILGDNRYVSLRESGEIHNQKDLK